MPVIGERGRGGGLALDKSYSLPPVNFTTREAALLVAAGRWLERTRLMPFVETLRSAIDKVQGALPAARQWEVARLVSTLTWIGVPARLASAEVRAAVEHAWVHDVALRIAYDGARGITERNVRIEAVLLERTMTLLNCHDLDIDDKRAVLPSSDPARRGAAGHPLGIRFGRGERREFIRKRPCPRPRPHLACTDRPAEQTMRPGRSSQSMALWECEPRFTSSPTANTRSRSGLKSTASIARSSVRKLPCTSPTTKSAPPSGFSG